MAIYTGHVTSTAAYNRSVLSPRELEQRASDAAATVRRLIRVLVLEIRIQLGAVASLHHLLNRFAARCTLYDAERLRALVQSNPGSAEKVLTIELAKFLHDAGLQPLIDSSVVGLRPDLFDLRTDYNLYVEAKQYSGTLTIAKVRGYAAQIWSTWQRMRSSWPITEAFLVIFRLGGTHVLLPKEVSYEGLRLFCCYVDIADASHAGSRATTKPMEVVAADLLPVPSNEPMPLSQAAIRASHEGT